jgi:hypothetical protein
MADGDQAVLAEGHTIPLAWDGTDPGLGPGIDTDKDIGEYWEPNVWIIHRTQR